MVRLVRTMQYHHVVERRVASNGPRREIGAVTEKMAVVRRTIGVLIADNGTDAAHHDQGAEIDGMKVTITIRRIATDARDDAMRTTPQEEIEGAIDPPIDAIVVMTRHRHKDIIIATTMIAKTGMIRADGDEGVVDPDEDLDLFHVIRVVADREGPGAGTSEEDEADHGATKTVENDMTDIITTVAGVPIGHHDTHRAGVVSDDDDANHHHADAKNVPAVEKSPSNHDDSIGHYTGREGSVIADRYTVIKEVGVGTFGRVLECRDLDHRHRDAHRQDIVAIKVVRDVKRYHESAIIEADIIRDVNLHGGRGLSHCAVMYDAFSYHGHYCMVFESLGPSLYDFLKRHDYQPFPVSYVRDFSQQLLETLEFLHSYKIIHTDLKLENLLLLNDRTVKNKSGQKVPESSRIKVIDFGGATYDDQKKSSIVNTRQYRAPEVILGCGWSMPSDLWSLGCILMELYQGELLFPTHDNIEHLGLIEKTIGPFPRNMLNQAQNEDLVNDAFGSNGKHRLDHSLSSESLSFVKSVEPLESMVSKNDKWFLLLLRRILTIDPEQRATAHECLQIF